LPIVKVGEPDSVGELQNGDELRHACEPSLLRRATGFKTVLRSVGLMWFWDFKGSFRAANQQHNLFFVFYMSSKSHRI